MPGQNSQTTNITLKNRSITFQIADHFTGLYRSPKHYCKIQRLTRMSWKPANKNLTCVPFQYRLHWSCTRQPVWCPSPSVPLHMSSEEISPAAWLSLSTWQTPTQWSHCLIQTLVGRRVLHVHTWQTTQPPTDYHSRELIDQLSGGFT